jgi:GntR family transcriptional regulator, carbon starvation induced regulator
MEEWVTRIDWAMHRLSEGVLRGQFSPGQRLKAQELAADWGISPTPVREALQRMATMGLVEAVPNRGMRVAPLAPDEMREVYSLRLLLEPFALRLSLENRDGRWEQEITDAFDALELQLAAGAADLIAFEHVHAEFHDALLSRADSTWLMRIIETLGVHSVRYRLLSLGPRGGASEVLEEHRRLYLACVDGDVDAAVQALFDHIRRTVTTLTDSDEVDRLTTLFAKAGQLIHTEDAVT